MKSHHGNAARIRRNGHAPVPSNHRPFALAPLLELLDDIRPADLHPGQPTTAWENAQLQLNRAARGHYETHGMTPYTADAVAMRLGLHPAEIWGDQWWNDARNFAIEEVA
ncbi:MAG: hypothetical protein Q8K63_13755 [Acidimicrobiales bacterium]|nr:hypothetical protein [Acidimicrobiales bacterium]